MTDGLKRRLDALRGLAPRLNAVADEANAIVKEVETALVKEMGLGVSTTSDWFATERRRRREEEAGEPTDEEVDQHLAFGRLGASYCIHVLEVTYRDPDADGVYNLLINSERIPWSQCDRETRLRASAKLPELLDAILAEVKKVTKAADAAAARIREMTSVCGDDEAPDDANHPEA